jgi:hypothetical protein
MIKPDAEQYARVVLWHLAGIRADIMEMQADLLVLQGKKPVWTSEKAREKASRQYRKIIYEDALARTSKWEKGRFVGRVEGIGIDA